MVPAQISRINPEESSRCDERNQKTDHRKSLTPGQKTDAAIKGTIERALWNDDVLRAIESYEVEVQVKNGIVYLNGHIVSTTSQSRIKDAIRAIPGLLGIQNNLIMDDKLTREVAASLGTLEHTYGCKFFTGASHGVVSLNGIVSDEDVKLLAERLVANNPNVRAVINNVQVLGAERELRDQRFLQPVIGEKIYFLDGISGMVRQVIINQDDRRVVAMILRGQFANQPQELKSTDGAQGLPSERLIVVPVDLIRYMTKDSGFLHISSRESKRYMDFNPTRFSPPTTDWKAPYPYCPDDVLFPVEKREAAYQILKQLPRSAFVVARVEQPLREELLANDSLGG